MSSPEEKPSDVLDPAYWLPAENTNGLISHNDDSRLKQRRKIDLRTLANKLSEASENWRPPDRSLPHYSPIELQNLLPGTLIRFDREYLTGAGHANQFLAAKMIGDHEVTEAGLIGLSYERQPFNEPEPGMHWSYLYERQVGFGVVWARPWGEKVVFSVRPKTDRVPLGLKMNKFGVPSEAMSIQRFEPALLKLPITAGAKIGISNQYHETKVNKQNESSHLFIVERFNALDIFDS